MEVRLWFAVILSVDILRRMGVVITSQYIIFVLGGVVLRILNVKNVGNKMSVLRD